MNHRHLISMLALMGMLVACESGPDSDTALPVETGPDLTVKPAPIETSPLPVEQAETAPPETAPTPTSAIRYTVDGMVGQVNGQALYARDIFEPIHEQLLQLAKQNPGMAFRRPGIEAISQRVREVVQNALILGEAERDLDEQQQQALAYTISAHREELLRRYGRGSVAVAEDQIQQQRGISLNDAIEEYRQQIVVRRYLSSKLIPRINVTRRDVERYYRDYPDQFNPPATRTLRLILTDSDTDAAAITAALADDADFAELAGSSINQFKRSTGGQMKLDGDDTLAMSEVNDQIATLTAGQYAGPIKINAAQWFVYLESVEQPEGRSLKDAQLKIEQRLREQQFRILREQFMTKILAEGSYTSLEQIVRRLYDIAETRYATSFSSSS